jgi:hypothetical protein
MKLQNIWYIRSISKQILIAIIFGIHFFFCLSTTTLNAQENGYPLMIQNIDTTPAIMPNLSLHFGAGCKFYCTKQSSVLVQLMKYLPTCIQTVLMETSIRSIVFNITSVHLCINKKC